MFKFRSKVLADNLATRKNLENAFFTAVIVGDLEQIRHVYKLGFDPNTLNEDGLTALHLVAEKGDIVVGKYLLQLKRINVNEHKGSRTEDTPLMTAVIFNRDLFVSLLLQNGADPSLQNKFGKTALHFAIRRKNVLMVKTLLFSKAAVNISDTYGNTPLSWSTVEYPSLVIAQILIKWGADPNFRAMMGQPLLLELALECRSHQQLNMIKLLTKYGADLNIKHPISKQTALHMASITGYVPLTRLLLKLGINERAEDLSGRTARQVAQEHQHPGLLEFYKERDKLLKEIISCIPFGPVKEGPSFTAKKKPSNRTVRFSEMQSVESEDDLAKSLEDSII